MTRSWFLDAANKALAEDMLVYEGPRKYVVIVPSRTKKNLEYVVSRQWCTCSGHYYTGRCVHRALAIAWIDILGLEPLSRYATHGRAVVDFEAEKERRRA